MTKLGDTVLYTPKAIDGYSNDDFEQRAAIVTKVHDDGSVDLMVQWRNQPKPVLGVSPQPRPNGTFSAR
jgi:hypothetical protein